MNTQFAQMSTDLRRISYWIISERYDLVTKMTSNMRNKYQIKGRVGKFQDIWLEIEKLSGDLKNKYIRADYATTLSSILLQESYKV